MNGDKFDFIGEVPRADGSSPGSARTTESRESSVCMATFVRRQGQDPEFVAIGVLPE